MKILEQTIFFYKRELKKEDLTEKERSKYLLALESIKKIIKEKERSGEKEKHKKIIPYDQKKAVFQNSKRGY
ncbi:hypothetical protein E3V08_02495 [Candidatus Atribacteria bacterium MT.SAG.1]|nr:hypothetical protein E3V08_02495 [Candidatus Atribacteria bacterium MT.SAG.1]